MSVLLITLATGPAYHEYANGMIASSHRFWPEAQTLVFTDSPYSIKGSDMCAHTEPKGYPGETLLRYHTFLKAEALLRKFDYVFFSDADMQWVAPPGDITSDGLVVTLHPGYYGRKGTTETRKESTAFCDWNTAYYAGGFQGGATDAYIRAMRVMRDNIDADAKNGITAAWHDESHFNRYAADNPPSKVLTPAYCYPEGYSGQWGWAADKFEPILLALNKNKRQGRG